jgi:hypothetical protein
MCATSASPDTAIRHEIDGLDIHFIHVRSPHENALPLIVIDLAAIMLDHGDGTGQPGLVAKVLEGACARERHRSETSRRRRAAAAGVVVSRARNRRGVADLT